MSVILPPHGAPLEGKGMNTISPYFMEKNLAWRCIYSGYSSSTVGIAWSRGVREGGLLMKLAAARDRWKVGSLSFHWLLGGGMEGAKLQEHRLGSL